MPLNKLKNIGSFAGLEFCTFKMKPGASEQQLIAAAIAAEDEFLSKEAGFLGHGILKDGNGLYVDIAFATSQEKAQEICAKWTSNDFALKYLEFIDSDTVNMNFWERIK